MAQVQGLQELPYVRLDEEYVESVCWSNDPGDLALETYFNPAAPNLETDYHIKGLQPVLRESEGTYRFILKDEKDRLYVWDEDGHMFWVKNKALEKEFTMEDKVDYIICRLGYLQVEPVFQDYHPADDPNLEDIRAVSRYHI